MMSAFVVEDSCINGPLSLLLHSSTNTIPDLGRIRKLLRDVHPVFDVATRAGCISLGAAMFDLNCTAINQRYGENQAREFRELDYKFVDTMPPNLTQAYKSLQCWRYQCAEGNVPETALYQAMETILLLLAAAIVETSGAYQAAKWGGVESNAISISSLIPEKFTPKPPTVPAGPKLVQPIARATDPRLGTDEAPF